MKPWIDQYLLFSAGMLGLTLLFCLFELWRPVRAISTSRDRLPNLAYRLLSLPLITLMQQFVFAPVFALLVYANGGWLTRYFGAPATSTVGVVAFALVFAFVWDLWHYALHRLQHASPLLWETHRFHHSDAAINATTPGRNHLSGHLLNLVWHMPILLLFGALSPHAFVDFLLFRCWGFVNHANVQVGFGPLTGIIAGPQWHRIHHSTELRHRDRNFATFFPFIDKLFGTYYAPAADEYPATGLVEAEGESFLRQATYGPLANWASRASRAIRDANGAASRTLESALD